MRPPTSESDPRAARRADEALVLEELEPVVGAPVRKSSTILIASGFAVAAIALFLLLNSHRSRTPADSLIPPAAEVAAVSPPVQAPPPPIRIEPPPAAIPVRAPLIPTAIPSPNFSAPPPPALPAPQANDVPAGIQRERAPTMVVDLGPASGEPPRVQASNGPAPINPSLGGGAVNAGGPSAGGAATLASAAGALAAGATNASTLGSDDQFAERVGEERPARSRATTLRDLDALIPQGAIIPAVLETAIDSDLPGYTRAVVSRDVRSFDGKSVLIPRGSRIIGQYKSALSLGASRAFIIWTRIIRSDGVSIQIGSPGTDPLGRGGLAGEVNRHFFTRFGGSILLSVLNAGIAAVSRTPSTNITIGSPGAAMGAANSAQGADTPPTIKVAQGSAVNIFVARDLDFAGVAAVK